LPADPSETILLIIVFISAVVAVKVLVDVMSPTHRRRYTKVVKYNLLLSLSLGLLFSLYEALALAAAGVISSIVLASSFYYYLIGGRLLSHSSLQAIWIPKESVKDWFFNVSLFTGVVGVATTVVSVLLPYFTSFSLSNTIPLSFDGLAVLAALLDFTIMLPNSSTICGLIYVFCYTNRRFQSGDVYVEDIDFEKMVAHTTHTVLDVREALESLVKQGFAVKQSPTPMGRVRFKVNIYGAKYLEVCWTETLIRMAGQKERIENTIAYVENRAKSFNPSDRVVREKALEELKSQRLKIQQLKEDYGLLLGDTWFHNITGRLEWLKKVFEEGEHTELQTQDIH